MIDILKYMPQNIVNLIKTDIELNYNSLEEIRIRANKPIILKFNNIEKIINYNSTTNDILEIMQYICENSIYSYQEQICNGYINLKGGHRVGITGNVVFKENKVVNITYISSLNFRIAKQIIGVSNVLLPYLLDIENNTIYNTLIISPPGSGKTTILRDFIRQISNGISDINFRGITVGLVDERGEIAAMYKGIPQNDVGIKTDILDSIPKSVGMKMLIRSMAPNVITADEIGTYEDVEAINYAICCGIKGIFTAHGNSLEDLELNPAINKLIHINIFDKIICLNPKEKGKISKLYKLEKSSKKYTTIL